MTKVASVLVPEALMHILSAQNEDETDALGQDETSSGPATQRASNKWPSSPTQRTSNQSPSPASQRTVNQSPAAATQHTSNHSSASATQYTADQPPAAVVTRRTLDQSSKSTHLPTGTLPKNIKKQKQSSMMKDKTKKRKVNAPSDKNNTNQKRGSVPQDEDKSKKKKKQYDRRMKIRG